MMKKTLIALLVTQLAVLAGCDVTKQIWGIYSSTREGTVSEAGIWDIQEPDRRFLLVMVHGYDSSNDQAWGEFPRIIALEKDTAFVRFNVLRYGYGSIPCRNKLDIADRGDGLKSYLSDKLKNYDGMIIVGHSLGGLVAMHGLIDLAKARNDQLARIPVTVMTFGTPHLGVEGAERLRQLDFLCIDEQAKDVEVFNRASRELRKDWDSYFGWNDSKYHVAIRTFYGSDDTFVVQDSACGRFLECEQINPVNHVMMVKPSDTNHLAYIKLRVQVDSMTKLKPITKPMTSDDKTTLLKTCGPSPLTMRIPEEFFSQWVALVEKFRHRNEQFQDLEHLTELNIPRDAGPHPVHWHQEATYTLRCLEKKGKLKIEKFDPPRMYRGGFENLKIIFPE